jgi:hypothetical protein
MIKCYARQIDGGICVSRQGRVLSTIDMKRIHSLPDREVCRHKQGRYCICGGLDEKKAPEKPRCPYRS